jgi:hypothetical protein
MVDVMGVAGEVGVLSFLGVLSIRSRPKVFGVLETTRTPT